MDIRDYTKYTFVITTLGTIFISITLLLMRQANRAAFKSVDSAIEAAKNSERIGKAQVRAYLVGHSSNYESNKDYISLNIEIENVGQSPARNVRLIGVLTLTQVGGFHNMPRVHLYRASPSSETYCQPVSISRATSEEVVFYWKECLAEDNFKNTKEMRRFLSGFNQLSVEFKLKWDDVFDDTHEFNFSLDANFSKPEQGLLSNNNRSGNMILRMNDDNLIVVDG